MDSFCDVFFVKMCNQKKNEEERRRRKKSITNKQKSYLLKSRF